MTSKEINITPESEEEGIYTKQNNPTNKRPQKSLTITTAKESKSKGVKSSLKSRNEGNSK